MSSFDVERLIVMTPLLRPVESTRVVDLGRPRRRVTNDRAWLIGASGANGGEKRVAWKVL